MTALPRKPTPADRDEILIEMTRVQEERDLARSRLRRMEEDRNRYIRLFNRIDAAISHHKRMHDLGLYFIDVPDEALWAARDHILRDMRP